MRCKACNAKMSKGEEVCSICNHKVTDQIIDRYQSRYVMNTRKISRGNSNAIPGFIVESPGRLFFVVSYSSTNDPHRMFAMFRGLGILTQRATNAVKDANHERLLMDLKIEEIADIQNEPDGNIGTDFTITDVNGNKHVIYDSENLFIKSFFQSIVDQNGGQQG